MHPSQKRCLLPGALLHRPILLAPSACPPPLQDIEQGAEMLILGVILRSQKRLSCFSCASNLESVHRFPSCSPCPALALADALSTVTEATTASRLLYASPNWTSTCFGQWWHLTPMCSISFSCQLPKGRIICILVLSHPFHLSLKDDHFFISRILFK